ncbi:methionyl-tRNA formyltransferase [Frigoribacterium sp. 2-23]|uniref:methionyl-tRNA formyltransferase n=1 Tax=Frigoribacterium sp. 2-23 TaxID=3415006 RepID=UPI003C6F48FD
MRLVFAGSPAAAVPSLLSLIDGPHDVVAVLTRDDTPQGRRRVLTPTPVAVAATEAGIPVLKTRRITDEVTAQVNALGADLGVIVAYGALLREPLLSTPRLGWVNLHFSLLPRWRGAAPVQRALMAGDDVTGAAVFQLVPELDAGDVYGVLEHRLHGDETAGQLLTDLADEGAGLLARVVDELAAGTAHGVAQTGEPTSAAKLTLADGRLDPSTRASSVLAVFRGVTPEPGAHLLLGDDRVKVLEARATDDAESPLEAGRFELRGRRVVLGTADRPIELAVIQPPGKKPMPAADWWRGLPVDLERRFA